MAHLLLSMMYLDNFAIVKTNIICDEKIKICIVFGNKYRVYE